MAVLTVYQHVFLSARAYDDPYELVVLENRGAYNLGQDVTSEHQQISWPDYRDLLARQRSFAALGGITGPERVVAEIRGRLRSTPARFVTSDFLTLLGVRASAGRILGAADFDAHAPPVALLTEGLWGSHFGSDPDVLGRALRVEGQPVFVVGVIPDAVIASLRQRREVFEDADRNQGLILPLVAGGDGPAAARLSLRHTNRVFPMLTVVARLRPGTSLSSARADISTIALQLSGEFPESNAGRTLHANRVDEWITDDVKHLRPMLIVIAVLALLVSCASAVGLMMADVVRREPEMAVRHALGASLGSLTGLVLQRSIVWALPGAALGLTLAWMLLPWVDVAGTAASAVRLSARLEVVGAAAGLAILAGLALGAVGVWMLRHQDFSTGIREAGAAASASRRRRRALSLLVGLQVATATSLGFVSLLLLRSMANVYDVDLGFQVGQSFVFRVQLPQGDYRTAADQSAFFERALSRIRGLAGVASVALGDSPPLTPVAVTMGSRDFAIEVPGRAPEALPPLGGQRVSADYFETLGMRIVHGRAFSGADIESGAPVLMVDDAFWRARFADVDPLQATMRMADTRYKIVGVVAAVRQSGPMNAARPMIYLPRRGARSAAGYFVVRPYGSAHALIERVVSQVVSLDAGVLVDDPRTLGELLQRTLTARLRMLRLLTLTAASVLLLTAFSVAGVLSEFVEHQVREIALRKALGASARHTFVLVCGSIGIPGSTGVLLGCLGGFLLARALSSELYGVEPLDVAMLAAAVVGLMTVGIAAAAGPIRRALRIDPARALRML